MQLLPWVQEKYLYWPFETYTQVIFWLVLSKYNILPHRGGRKVKEVNTWRIWNGEALRLQGRIKMILMCPWNGIHHLTSSAHKKKTVSEGEQTRSLSKVVLSFRMKCVLLTYLSGFWSMSMLPFPLLSISNYNLHFETI